MNRFIYIAGLLLLVVVLGWGATQIGGVGIRRINPLGENITLVISNPVLPGVDVVVRWNLPTQELDRNVTFLMRTPTDTILVGSGKLRDGSARVRVVCDQGGQTVGLSMTDATSKQLFASVDVQLLPDGPDCFK